jgi:methyltransferase (TIGR00027 family)
MGLTGGTRALESVSDTALLVAHHRAMESARSDALFRDPLAGRLAGERGEQIARKLLWGRRTAWSTVTRTVLMDEIVLRLAGQGVDTVLNLAAGLDARPYRLDLPASLRWVEMDLPAMTAAKNQALEGEPPRCRLERVAVDLADTAGRQRALAECASRAGKMLVMSEGLLVYLSATTVTELARDLHQQPAIQYWMFDLMSPLVLKRVQKWWGKQMKAANAWMQFAPAEGTRFFELLGWREAEFHDLFLSSLRLNRTMPLAWLLKLQMKLLPKRTHKRLQLMRSGVALMERR